MNPMNPMNNNMMMNNQIMNNMMSIPSNPPNMPPDKIEIINHLMNQNLMLQNQIQMNNNLIQKIIENYNNVMKNDINANNSEIRYPKYFEYPGPNFFIKFCVSTGYKYNMSVPCSVPISKLMSDFITCHGLSEGLIDADVIFLLNGSRIKKDDQRTLAQFNIRDNYTITVFDSKNCFKNFVK